MSGASTSNAGSAAQFIVGDSLGARRERHVLAGEHDATARFIDSAFDAVIAIERDGRVVEWNQRAEALFGWQRAEVVGPPLVDLIIPQRYRDAHRSGLERYHRVRAQHRRARAPTR